MQKKKILVIAPVTPQKSDIESIATTLAFLNKQFTLDFVDPLSLTENSSDTEYYSLWEQQLLKTISQYDIYFGFSFGGVILQQCFSLFAPFNKPILLFSTPTFADDTLKQKLGQVIELCNKNKLDEALQSLYQHVYYPNKMSPMLHQNIDQAEALNRMIFGLLKVLETDSTDKVTQSTVPHIHLIGELSHLVNKDNVLAPKSGRLITIPGAGMRVLQDNPTYCEQVILETLNCEIH